ncbi:MAG TPA: alanine--tRNA ligase-related protein, partial [Tepidisphaeraceae bacterium]|nr:alanine--tRNA ligase-related protein [Tepidisphaeraceae bacterium]
QHVIDIIKDEELSFIKTLDRGISLFEQAADWAAAQFRSGAITSYSEPPVSVAAESDDERRHAEKYPRDKFPRPIISDEVLFRLYDTYGFPPDLTRIMAEERGFLVDLAGYEKLMEQAKELSRGAEKGAGHPVYDLPPQILDELQKMGVHATDDSHKFRRGPARATVRAIWNGHDLDESSDASDARPGEQVAVILDKTSFYAEMGGQVGDTGELNLDSGSTFIVETTRAVGPFVLHIGHVKTGAIRVGDGVTAHVYGGRDRTEKNHTSTHLANWALRETLGDHVQQKGSLVDPDKLRFDFIHNKALADEEIAKVETLVNTCIEMRLVVDAEVAPQEQALKIFGLRAVFGEKYPPMVRVVAIGATVRELLKDPTNPKWKGYSVEFCGGTHLGNAMDAERFVVTAEESVSKGIRRIVALTGASAAEAIEQGKLIEGLITQAKSAGEATLPGVIAALQKSIAGGSVPLLSKRRGQAAISELQDRYKKWQKQQDAQTDTTGGAGGIDAEGLLKNAEAIGSAALIVASVPGGTADVLRNTWDWLKRKHPQQQIAVLLASEVVETDKDGNKLPPKVNLLAAVGDPLVGKLKAGDWIKAVAPIVGGSGGGRPQLAMAGGKDVSKIESALIAARAFAKEKLA